MTIERRHLQFLCLSVDLLHAERDFRLSTNSMLVQAMEYLGLRCPCLLLRDMVTGSYTVELSPEVPPHERQRLADILTQWKGFRGLATSSVLASDLADVPGQHALRALLPDMPDSLVLVMLVVGDTTRDWPSAFLAGLVQPRRDLGMTVDVLRRAARVLGMRLSRYGYQLRNDEPARQQSCLPGVVGQSPPMLDLGRQVRTVAPSRASVLIGGESGTGKEMVARALHQLSIRASAPFVAVNCAALSPALLESELFGHERGAFTGAHARRIGRFEQANGGTLFLDEIGETSPEFQTRLLRVLQEGEFERVGGNQSIAVDVRILCATNVDLEEAVRQRTFREDLYYRINVVQVRLPALRQRGADIWMLAEYFLEELNQEQGSRIALRRADRLLLEAWSWPGNVRELQNAVHRAFLEQRDGFADFGFLQRMCREHLPAVPAANRHRSSETQPNARDQAEIEQIRQALALHGGIQTRAARELGISLRQLRYRIEKYGIRVHKLSGGWQGR